jgi:hypothetical protein
MDETLHPELLLEFGDETVVLATAFSQKLTKGIYNFSLRLTMRSPGVGIGESAFNSG